MKPRMAILGLAVVLLLAMSGPVGAFQDDAGAATITVTVPGGTQGWMDSGIQLEAGDIYAISASGTINIWPNCEETKAQEGLADLDCTLVTAIGPSGTTAFDPAEMDYPYPGGLVGGLVARVGDEPAFLVGSGGTFTASVTGSLLFAINENAYMEDNGGQFIALVTVPDPVLLLSLNGTWQDTGIVLEAGQAFTITASGTINIWPNCEETKAEQGYPDLDCALTWLGPEGTTIFDPAESDYPMPGANVGALVARIGEGEPFLVGPGGAFIADVAGPLRLAVNDTDFWSQDDQGSFNIVITTDAESTGTTIYVPGTLEVWMSTGVEVAEGDTITLSASGVLNIWPNCEAEKDGEGLSDLNCALMSIGPTGTTAFELAPDDYPLPGGRVGALVARIGEGEPFLVGNGGDFPATTSGVLQLRINDTFGMGDNVGGFVVVIGGDDDSEPVAPEAP